LLDLEMIIETTCKGPAALCLAGQAFAADPREDNGVEVVGFIGLN